MGLLAVIFLEWVGLTVSNEMILDAWILKGFIGNSSLQDFDLNLKLILQIEHLLTCLLQSKQPKNVLQKGQQKKDVAFDS